MFSASISKYSQVERSLATLSCCSLPEPCMSHKLKTSKTTGDLSASHLRTFVPIATAHLYCARHSLSTHVPRHSQAHALSRKLNKNIEPVTLTLTWCANIFVGWSVTPNFFFGRSLPFPILSMILKNKKKMCVGSFNYFLQY